MKIVLFDPSLKDNTGQHSDNLGDVIIYEFVRKIIDDLFPSAELVRIATHTMPDEQTRRSACKADLHFLGGTNILNSTVNIYNNWKFDNSFFNTLFSRNLPVVSLGTGWGEYQGPPNFYSRLFYRKRLSRHFTHAVRDSYTLDQLGKINGLKILNTGCPTTWSLDNTEINKVHSGKGCIFTLTDYSRNVQQDNKLITALLEHFSEIVFFPQGKDDLSYLNSLDAHAKNKERFSILERNLGAFKSVLQRKDLVYIGTRLHAGILALNKQVDALILALDNRAAEMGRDTGLPVIARDNHADLIRWIKGEKIFSKNRISIPLSNIDQWKAQFKK